MTVVIVLVIIVALMFAVGYFMFASVFDMKNFHYEDPKDDEIDNERDLMRPTARRYYEFRKPYRDVFFDNHFEDLYIKSFDGLKLHGYLLRGTSDEVIICVHGYKASPEIDYADKLEMYKKRGCSVLMIDDRAFGKSEGRYTGFSEHDKYDVRDWVGKINEMFESPRIYLHGISMGGATVVHSADMHLKNVKGIIDDCGFTSIDEITRFIMKTSYHLPYFPIGNIASMFSKIIAHIDFNGSNGEESVKCGEVPIVFIHGRSDHFVPCEMSERMYEKCTGPKDILLVEGCGHAACYAMAKEEYEKIVYRLLDGEIK